MSPTPAQPSLAFRRIKEEIVGQIPAFLETLNELQIGPAAGKSVRTKNSGQSPKKKRKVASDQIDPTSFSDEELSEAEENDSSHPTGIPPKVIVLTTCRCRCKWEPPGGKAL